MLQEAGWPIVLLGREWIQPSSPVGVVIAVPDRAIASVAVQLADSGLPADTPVLHTSGSTGVEALEPLATRGCSCGGLHPLAAANSPDALRDIWWGVEANGPALALAERIVRVSGGQILSVPAEGRALYHASAVLASNALVALLAVAEGVMERSGVIPEQARSALAALAGGALGAVERLGPVAALTGPVSRGDVDTVRAHLAQLSPTERAVYSALAREALILARQRGLDPAAAAALETLLGGPT